MCGGFVITVGLKRIRRRSERRGEVSGDAEDGCCRGRRLSEEEVALTEDVAVAADDEAAGDEAVGVEDERAVEDERVFVTGGPGCGVVEDEEQSDDRLRLRLFEDARSAVARVAALAVLSPEEVACSG